MFNLSNIFSNKKSLEVVSELPPDSNLINLPEFIKETIQVDIYENKLYELGVKQGRLLIEHKTQLSAIEGKYNGFIQFLKEAKRKEVEKSKIEAEIIQKEVEKLDIALNEYIDNSEISKFKIQIEIFENQLKEYDKNLYEDSFLNESIKLSNEEIESEKKNIKLLLEEYYILRETVKKEIDSIKHLFIELEQNGSTSDKKENIIKKLKSILKVEYPIALTKLKDIEELSEELLNIKGEQIENSYKYIENYISQLKPKIYRRSHILTYYLLSFLIFIGEFYLIYNFTTEVLMPNSKPTLFIDYLYNPINIALIGFSLALPLAIGMIVKLFLQEYPLDRRAEFIRNNILKPLGVLTFIGLIAISFPNSIQILKANNIIIDTVFGFQAKWIKLISIIVFSPILTLVFSTVGAILFLYAIEMHKDFTNTRKESLIRINRKWLKINVNNYKTSLEEKRNKTINKIEKLKARHEEKNKELVEAKANCTSQSDSDFFVGLISNYRETAKNYFISGYKIGVAETKINWDELDYLFYNVKQKLSKKNNL